MTSCVIAASFFVICLFLLNSKLKNAKPIEQQESDLHILVNLTNFKYLINKPPVEVTIDKNGVQLPTFLIMIHVHPYHDDIRAAIRETWGRGDPRALVYFALGAVRSAEKQREIELEDAQYHDIIQGNFIDAYHNLSYKHSMVLKWFSHNANDVNFLVKIDDDVYPHVPSIYNYITKFADEKEFLMGPYIEPERVHRTGKYAVSRDDWKDDWVPPYAIGNYLIYSADVARAIYEKSKTTRFFWLDDVFLLGFCRMQLNIRVVEIRKHRIIRDELKQALQNETLEPRHNWMFTSPVIKAKDARILWNKLQKYKYNAIYD